MDQQINKIDNEQPDKLIIESDWSMNSLKILMPYSYVSNLVNLNWYDILFAVRNGFLPYQSAVEHAIVEVENNKEYPQAVFDLACLFLNEADEYVVTPLLKELTKQIPDDIKYDTKDKILYVLLNWVFEHRQSYKDPLEAVEFVYDDFNFPDSIKHFIRYQPSDEPSSGSLEANIERIYNKWKIFLDEQKLKYSNN